MTISNLEDIRYLIEEEAWVLATQKCRAEVQKLGLSSADVKQMLLALTQNDHRKDFGPAESDFGTIQADDYKLWFDEQAKTRCLPDQGCCFYIKLGIHTNNDGQCCAVVSFHLDSRP